MSSTPPAIGAVSDGRIEITAGSDTPYIVEEPNSLIESHDPNCTSQTLLLQTLPSQTETHQTVPRQIVSTQTTPRQVVPPITRPLETRAPQSVPHQAVPPQASPHEMMTSQTGLQQTHPLSTPTATTQTNPPEVRPTQGVAPQRMPAQTEPLHRLQRQSGPPQTLPLPPQGVPGQPYVGSFSERQRFATRQPICRIPPIPTAYIIS